MDTRISSNPLRHGDHIRVVSFGLSLRGAPPTQRAMCNATLARIGLKVSFGDHVDVSNEFDTSPVSDRIRDLHTALVDRQVKMIMSGLGGMNSAQLLRYIDWDLIRQEPKVFCGFSDVGALLNAIYAKTGMTTYYGPFYSTFGMKEGADYMLEMFTRCLFSSDPYTISAAPMWSDDMWWLDQENRCWQVNPGPLVLSEGEAEGTLVGGHLTSIAILFGTEFMPPLAGSIVLIEENSEIRPRSFDRLLQALIHQPGFDEVRALLIGRFTSASRVSESVLTQIVRSYPQLLRIPVIANLSVGHTYPQFTCPIGGTVRVKASTTGTTLDVLRH